MWITNVLDNSIFIKYCTILDWICQTLLVLVLKCFACLIKFCLSFLFNLELFSPIGDIIFYYSTCDLLK